MAAAAARTEAKEVSSSACEERAMRGQEDEGGGGRRGRCTLRCRCARSREMVAADLAALRVVRIRCRV